MSDFPQPAQKQLAATAASERSMRSAVERALDEADEVRRPSPIPDHTLLHRIGSGAYGDVWLARNALGTLRAVKVVYRARFEEAHPYEREFNGILKFEPISRTHEGLVQVLHVGRNDETGCFYYVMELADAAEIEKQVSRWESEKVASAVTISPAHFPACSPANYSPRTLRSELRRQHGLPPTNAAQLVLCLASALQHLHSQGLVHRDIKPSNVIFVNGKPKLADIGLVTAAGDSRSFVGTEGFIAPEGPGTPQADIFSLGKLLYELATGRDRMDFPQLPIEPGEPSEQEALLELNEVITRACAPDAASRYSSAREMYADLALFLGGHSLREARKTERHVLWLRHFAFAACVVVVCAAGAVWFSKRAESAARERERRSFAQAQVEAGLRARAESAERDARQQLYTALLEQARATVRSGELGQRILALDAARRAFAISNSAELRREVFAALALPDMKFEKELPRTSELSPRRADPKLERLAWNRGREAIEIRAVSDNRWLATLPASTNLPASTLTWSPDGTFLAVERDHDGAGQRADVEVWNVTEAKQLFLLKNVPWGANSFHPTVRRLMVGERGSAVILDLESGRRTSSFSLNGTARELQFAPDGERVAVSCGSGNAWTISVHGPDGAQQAAAIFTNFIQQIAWHPGGQWLAACDDSGAVHLIDARTGGAEILGRHKAVAAAVAFSPEGNYLFSGGWENELICWDVRAKRRAFSMRPHGFTAQWSSDGERCAIVTDSGVQIHRFERPTMHREFAEDLGVLRFAAFSPDGRWLAVPGDERLGVWDLKTAGAGILLKSAPERHAFFSPDSSELFVDGEGSFRRWRVSAAINATSSPKLEALPVYQPSGFSAACLVTNDVALTSGRGTRVTALRDIESGNERVMRTATGRNGVSPDGQWLGVNPPFSPFLYIHRWPHLERVAKLTNQANIANFVFSPTGEEVITGSRQRLEFWSTKTWQRTRELAGFRSILFAPEPNTAWLMEDYSNAGLYDLKTLQPLLLLPTGTVPLAMSADGKKLAVTVDNRRLQMWNLAAVREQLASWEMAANPSKNSPAEK